MNGAYEISGMALLAQQRALDAGASNIANIHTPGFKRSEVRFSEVLSSSALAAAPRADLGASPPLSGIVASVSLALDEQGEIETTGRPLDIALSGRGFIELMGPRGQSMLWRGGALSVQEDGLLATAGGLALRASIEIPETATALSISAEGVVRAIVGEDGAEVELGRIPLVDAPAAGLERLDGGVYRMRDDARTEDIVPGEGANAVFMQGAVERSNVDLNQEMVRLMIVQRAYAANAQVVQAADQLMAIANGLRK
ncbi:MAG TPA: flagellar hook basal-body protein [Vitreimonas sp.]|uniref:flagellar hook basal-body protein n=1 Tax=Vitreimonas sp. TaxID=3069702 RepID=UPI002D4CF1D4|nr:flagellar hook basal-body protein [Vitreimonas sp.]HYD85980.1 flagellar hook basal-body protein [Vitreimonas sp.]